MNDIGTNTSDVVVESNRSSTMEANAQISIPIVDVMLPSCRGGHLTIPQVNLSISRYEPDSLRTSHIRSPSMLSQGISIMPCLDGPGSLPMRDTIGRRTHEISESSEQETSQEDTYAQIRGREYREEESDNDGSRRPHRSQRPPNEGRYPNQGGRPLTKEDTLIEDLLEEDILIEMGDPLEEKDTLVQDSLIEMEDPLVMENLLVMEDPLDLLVDKNHWALRDHLDQ